MTSATTNIETPPLEPSTAPTNDAAPAPRWSLGRRIVFRFTVAHFALYFLPAPLTSVLPVVGEIIDNFISNSIWLPIIQVVGKYVLRLPGQLTHETTGSGDTTFDYVSMFTSLCLAAFITALWSFVQRQKNNHQVLESVFRIWLRYTLATVMIGYGAVKVVKLQFATPSPIQLLKPYGDSSPMNLLWTFMGFSTPYTFFAGLMEMVPALLLFFRRTALLGALLLMAVMGNVVMLNFCYDVPVKIYSTHLLIMASLIALPDLNRLWQFFLKNVPTEPAPTRKPFEKKWQESGRIVVKSLFIAVTLAIQTHSIWTGAHEYGPLANVPTQYGAYEVVSFTREGTEVPPLLTDKTRPRYFSYRGFNDKRFGTLVMMNGEKQFFNATIDAEKKTLSLEGSPKGDEKPAPWSFRYTETNTGFDTLEGTLHGAVVRFELRKVEADKFLLMNRGFHWVNEVPFNR